VLICFDMKKPTFKSTHPTMKSTYPTVKSTHLTMKSTYLTFKSTHATVKSTHPTFDIISNNFKKWIFSGIIETGVLRFASPKSLMSLMSLE
jgi:hypothetical protein